MTTQFHCYTHGYITQDNCWVCDEEEIKRLKGLLKVARCPNSNCRDEKYPVYDNFGGVDLAQCQWCDERKQLLSETDEVLSDE